MRTLEVNTIHQSNERVIVPDGRVAVFWNLGEDCCGACWPDKTFDPLLYTRMAILSAERHLREGDKPPLTDKERRAMQRGIKREFGRLSA